MKKYLQMMIALFFTALGIFLRFKALAGRELWADELHQIMGIRGSFAGILQRIRPAELAAFPGEYLTGYPFVMLFGENKWLINIPHYAFTFLGFYFLYLICRKYLATLTGFIIAFMVFTFNGNLIYHAFEFRPYAVLPALALGSFYLSGIAFDSWQGLSKLKKAGMAFWFIFTSVYHAYGFLIVCLSFVYFLVLKSKERGYKEGIAQVKGLFLFALLPAALLFACFSAWSAGWNYCRSANIDTFSGYPNPLNDTARFVRQVFANLMAHKAWGQKHLALGIWISFLLPQRERIKQAGFFLLMIVLPIILILLSDICAGYWFLDRQFVWVMALYAFFLGWCWDTIFLYLSKKLKFS